MAGRGNRMTIVGRFGQSLAALLLATLAEPAPAADPLPDWLAVHGQATVTLQGTPGFASPYAGANSLTPHQRKETFDATLYVGVRPWSGGELWVNPEVDQGFGLSNTLGVAGFPSAEAYKVGKKHPYTRLQRLFFRQTVNLGGESQKTDGTANLFPATATADRLVLTVGKFGLGDVFDTNKYAHDPRGDFLNWSLVDAGTFDYAADAWGYSTGVALEYYRGPWTLRAGAFNLSQVPNGETLERGFGQYQLVAELEHRHAIAGGEGAIRITLFRNRGMFGRFDEALALSATSGDAPDTALVRRRQTRIGGFANLEQAVGDHIGIFARAGLVDGQIEPYDFTDIDRTVSAGLSLDGALWGRQHDTIGIAGVANEISEAHRHYLNAGGLGVLVGDGRLPHAAPELIGELYYDWKPCEPIAITLDYQLVGNPGYNRDRGPAHVFGLRLHGQF